VLADTIAKNLLAEVQRTLAEVQGAGAGAGAGRRPCLAAFLANDDPAAVKYAEWSQKACEDK
jgi:methylenetetrahydrofolate dehydrogenase (NAD+)